MTNEKWQELIENVKTKFSNVSLETEDMFFEHKNEEVQQGTADVLQFDTPAGRFKIVRENKPLVLGKTMHYSHRQGDAARTEYTLSDTEFTHRVLFYKEDKYGEWQKMEVDNLNIF